MKPPRHPEGELEPFKDTRAASDEQLIEGEVVDGKKVRARGIQDAPGLPERLDLTDTQLERMQRLNEERDLITKSVLPDKHMLADEAERIMRNAANSPDLAALSGNDSEIPADLVPTIIDSRINSAQEFVDTIEHWARNHSGQEHTLDTLSLMHERHATLLENSKKFDPKASAVERQAVAGEVIRAWDKLRKMSEKLAEPHKKTT